MRVKREFLAFGQRVKRLLAERGETQSWLTARLNERLGSSYSSAAVGNWIGGTREPGLDLVRAIAEVLGVPPALLAFGEEVVTPTDAEMDAVDTKRGIGGGTHAKRPADKRRRAGW